MKTKLPNPILTAGLLAEPAPAPIEPTACFSVRLPASVATKAYLRALRQMEMEAWQRSGGDILRSTNED